jgi:hypothetical protein
VERSRCQDLPSKLGTGSSCLAPPAASLDLSVRVSSPTALPSSDIASARVHYSASACSNRQPQSASSSADDGRRSYSCSESSCPTQRLVCIFGTTSFISKDKKSPRHIIPAGSASSTPCDNVVHNQLLPAARGATHLRKRRVARDWRKNFVRNSRLPRSTGSIRVIYVDLISLCYWFHTNMIYDWSWIW